MCNSIHHHHAHACATPRPKAEKKAPEQAFRVETVRDVQGKEHEKCRHLQVQSYVLGVLTLVGVDVELI